MRNTTSTYQQNAWHLVLLLAVCCLLTNCREKHKPPIPKMVDFNFDVKPILVQKCYLCHGPDSGSRKAGLRLDTFEGATASLKEGGHAIVPGHPRNSKLIYRINSNDPEQVMPPPETKTELTAREIEVLTRWIEQGAEWKQHWSFIPPQLPDMAALEKEQNEIDFFINDKIKMARLQPSSTANKQTLIRRVSYLLTGLPPSTEAISIYFGDTSPDAYENMVDRYLNSSRFGEKWARNWMDVVRYAETKGHEFDYIITGAWHYRDYLIRAFNNDVPYDQLIKEHLAGDLMKTPRRNPQSGINESQIGTMFYVMTEGTHSPVDVRQDEADRIDNMIDVTSKAFQGLTVSCARCHDHKFDPIPAADYYGVYGIMEGTRFTPVPANITWQQEKNLAEARNIDAYIRQAFATEWKKQAVEVGNKSGVSINQQTHSQEYVVLGDFRGNDLSGWQSNGLAFGERTTLGNPVFNQKQELVQLAKGKASSRSLATGIFGALRSPNFTIDKKFIGVRATGKQSTVRIIIDNLQLISFPIYGEMMQRADKGMVQDLVFDVSLWKGHKAYIEIMPGVFDTHVYRLPKDAYIDVEYVIAYENDWTEPPVPAVISNASLSSLFDNWTAFNFSYRQAEQMEALLKLNRLKKQIPQVTELLSKRAELLNGIYDSLYYNGVTEGEGINSPVFIRGSHKQTTPPVPRKFLSSLPDGNKEITSKGSGREELAEAMISEQNPLTARVMVNRIWYNLFGRGLVETVDNFGLQGKLPTHPELLDYLAIRFQQENWSVKKLIKLVVMSETFQRSTNVYDQAKEKDPDNLLLASFPVLRLKAEDLRDGLLAASGRLDTTMYGPPVPVHITDFMQGRGRPKDSGPLDGNGRRSIYQEVRRNFLDPMMLTFDRPVPFTTFGKRNTTNVPAQSLILMNDPFVILQAEVMALNAMKLNEEERFNWIYLRAFSREPKPEELVAAKSFLLHLARLHDVKEADIAASLKVWKDYCHTIFNTKEFIYLI